MSNAASASSSTARYPRLDALRGVAIVWMAAFHFCFDLNFFGYLHPHQRFQADPFWWVQRTCIVTLFLLCAGMGQGIALAAVQGWPRFWRRWAQVAACALLVSLGSATMFPRTWISFGVLHGIAVMLLIVRLAAPPLLARGSSGRMAMVAAAASALALPHLVHLEFFDSRWTNWVGLVTRLPFTEDYVPVLPWLGVMLAGVLLADLLRRLRPRWLAGNLPSAFRPLAVLGTWSLSFYMLHQPVLIGSIRLWRWATTGSF